MADMKGDLSGISQAGKMSGFIEKRKDAFEVPNPDFQACPVRFFDVYGEQGHPIRATISSMGPQLLGRLLGLNETQTGILTITFRIADDKKLLLLDLKDLRAMLNYVGENASDFTATYGNITKQSVGAILRSLLELENQGADKFFGEPEFNIFDLIQTEGGKGVMNVLAADKLMLQPKLYSTFLLWMMSELYSQLPEVGDMEKPKLVFFFDEAHMLFNDTPKALVEKIEQVIRLIRSKGVGIYFVTQNPTDIPENILGQLGNRVQHALRAFTPKDQKSIKAAAQTFRTNPKFSTEEAITQLETGEALVSVLDEKGSPTVVERAKILFPLSQIGAISESERSQIIKQSSIYGRYDKMVDRESAFEVLLASSEKEEDDEEEEDSKDKKKASKKSESGIFSKIVAAVTSTLATILGTAVSNAVTGKKSRTTAGGVAGKVAKKVAQTAVKEITRDILGNRKK